MDFSSSNWSFWIAVLSLIISIAPTLRNLIKGQKVQITVPEQFSLFHYLGNLHLNIFVDIHNIGGTYISISRIECTIKDANDSATWILPAQSYISRQAPQPGQGKQEFLIGGISLKPQERWSEIIHCYKLFSDADDEKSSEIISKIGNNITKKRQHRSVDDPPQLIEADESLNEIISKIGNNLTKKMQHRSVDDPPQLIEADAPLVDEAVTFFDKRFNLDKGNYQLYIVAITDRDQVVALRGLEFTVFDSAIRSLRAVRDGYKYGFIPWSQGPTWLRLRAMEDNKAQSLYEKIKAQ